MRCRAVLLVGCACSCRSSCCRRRLMSLTLTICTRRQTCTSSLLTALPALRRLQARGVRGLSSSTSAVLSPTSGTSANLRPPATSQAGRVPLSWAPSRSSRSAGWQRTAGPSTRATASVSAISVGGRRRSSASRRRPRSPCRPSRPSRLLELGRPGFSPAPASGTSAPAPWRPSPPSRSSRCSGGLSSGTRRAASSSRRAPCTLTPTARAGARGCSPMRRRPCFRPMRGRLHRGSYCRVGLQASSNVCRFIFHACFRGCMRSGSCHA
mmetsp:Transcript_46915/g.146982  ORF Transcript_46915/g.146982 Transcript_46915/m.146982 type:complete len:267 (-) Transcript_46915:77-877(-)